MPVTSPAGDRRGRSAGFALYELILALAVLGLVAAVVFPRLIRPPGPAELRAKALEVAALLRSDRNAALREQREILSRIDLTRNAVVSGTRGYAVEIPRGVATKLVQSSREVRLDGGGIRFLPNGRSSGGVLSIRRGEVGYQVSVNWLTSSVSVSAAGETAR
jgi:general secretion pathway protein H